MLEFYGDLPHVAWKCGQKFSIIHFTAAAPYRFARRVLLILIASPLVWDAVSYSRRLNLTELRSI